LISQNHEEVVTRNKEILARAAAAMARACAAGTARGAEGAGEKSAYTLVNPTPHTASLGRA
jgi:hypothetical protein